MKPIIVTATLITTGFIFSSCNPYYHHMGGRGYMFGYGGFTMWITWIIIIGAIGFGAYYFFIKKGFPSAQATPLEILKKRYANGEITKEEFEKMKSELQ